MSSTQERCASLMYTHRYVYVRVIRAMFRFQRKVVKFCGVWRVVYMHNIMYYYRIREDFTKPATFVLVKVYAIFNA